MQGVRKRIAVLMGVALLTVGCSPATDFCGATRDRHGCIPSAGYVWSSLERRCLRPFEEGIPLNAIHAEDASVAAYLLVTEGGQAEVFTSNTPEGVVLNKIYDRNMLSGDILFENKKEEMAIVKKDIGHYLLRIGGNVRYASNGFE